MNEVEIIRKCQDGDKAAFRLLVRKYQGMVFALALRMMRNEDTAMDIVQETFIRIWVNIRRFDEAKSLRNWIYTIAVRRCMDALEKDLRSATTAECESALRIFAAGGTPEKRLENKELAAVVNELTERLSAKQRVVFTLVCLEGLDTAEVEAMTGLDAAKIKSNLYVARKTIKEHLRRMGYEG